MPDYTSLTTQIDGFKSELTALYASGQMTAKDLIYIAKALNELGTLLGVNDIAAATADGVNGLPSTVTSKLTFFGEDVSVGADIMRNVMPRDCTKDSTSF